jgi:photosystem II stability/assembly factor-like uncharacterized protein
LPRGDPDRAAVPEPIHHQGLNMVLLRNGVGAKAASFGGMMLLAVASWSGAAFGDEEPDTPGQAAEWRYAQRSYPGVEIPLGVYARGHRSWRALLDHAVLPLASSEGVSPHLGPVVGPAWTLLGPGPTSGDSGRNTALVIDPTNSNVVYAGFADGGVWKSTNGGMAWTPLTDDQPTLAVGAIVLDPKNSSIVYVGTGEGNFSSDSFYGRGILKSMDGGMTWAQIAADTFDSLSIPSMFIDPASGNLYVAAAQGVDGAGLGCNAASAPAPRRGLYKSTDGGAHFTQIVSGKNVADFELDTSATPPRGLLSVYKEGAFRFQEAAAGMATLTPITALPDANAMVTRIEFGRSKSNPAVIYAGAGFDTMPGTSALFVSQDTGATWTKINNAPNYCVDQCWYDNIVTVDPMNPGTVYLGGQGCAIARLTGGTSGNAASSCIAGGMHSDTHSIVFDPSNPQRIWLGTDGGLAVSNNTGGAWTKMNTGLSTLQFYQVCVDANDDTSIVGSLQDNGTVAPTATGSILWRNIQGADGMACANNLYDPMQSQRYMISSAQYGSLSRRTTIGQAGQGVFALPMTDRVPFVAALAFDANAPLNVYIGSHRLYKSTTGGTSGSFRAVSDDLTAGDMVQCANDRMRIGTIGAIAAASQRVYTGSFGGKVFTSPDGGMTWTDVTKAPLPPRFVSAFAVNPTNPSDVYVSFSGFNSVTPTAPGHIFHSTNAGATWTRFDTTLDIDLPVNSLARSANAVYAGHDFGVVGTLDGGTTWNPIGTALPHVAVFSLQYHKSGKLFASTHGRSAWSLTFAPSIVPSPSSLAFFARPGQTPPAQTLTVSNGDPTGSTLNFTAAATGAAWLSVTPGMGTAVGGAAGMALNVAASTTGLGLGDYMGSITLAAPNASPMSVTVPVVLHITDSGMPPSDAGSDAGPGKGDASADGSATGGSGGAATGGSGGATGGGMSGGTAGAGGPTGGAGNRPAGSGGSNPSTGAGGSGEDTGCGCRLAQTEPSSRWVALVLAAASLALARRRAREPRERLRID